MNTRCFYKRPRFGFASVAHITFADEDDELLEPWMIGPGNEEQRQLATQGTALHPGLALRTDGQVRSSVWGRST